MSALADVGGQSVAVYRKLVDSAVVGMVVASALNLSSELRFAVRFSTDMESKLNGFQRLEECVAR